MTPLFPPIEPFEKFHLPVDNTHEIYVEQCGNPDGIPVLFVHGGPGGSCGPDDRRFFNPEYYRIILFDQRGTGLSKPFASLEGISTQEFVGDIEKLRQHLAIEQWHVFGGSWGSTLSLVYAQTHPKRVMSLVVRGIFLARPQDANWIFGGGGATKIFADNWQKFVDSLPFPEQEFSVEKIYQLVTADDPELANAIARGWTEWEAGCCTLAPPKTTEVHKISDTSCFSHAIYETLFVTNNFYLTDNQILENCNRISHIPTVIVHGRYDMATTFDNAHTLHKHLPQSELVISQSAGHASREKETIHHLVNATEKFRLL